MKAMLLAAGRGERMRPLTDRMPKPLLRAGGKTLIEHRLEALKEAGITECVINLAYRGEQIRAALGDGKRLGLKLRYSDEGPQALEAGGGIIHALALLGDEPFVAVNTDIWTDFDFADLPGQPPGLAHLVLIDNPDHHPEGDFVLNNGRVSADGKGMHTYSGIGVYRPELFRPYHPGRRALRPILVKAMGTGRVSGQYHPGYWKDVGTPGRLAELEAYLRDRPG